MEHPHDPYHVRPFPEQPKRGGKGLMEALNNLEDAFDEETPDFEKIRLIQEKIHIIANRFNDDRLVDRLRQLSGKIDVYLDSPNHEVLQQMMEILLKIRVDLKHL